MTKTDKVVWIGLAVGVVLLGLVYLISTYERAPARPKGEPLTPKVTLDLGDGVQMTMVLIHPGTFEMGSPEGEEGRDKREHRHRVTISRPFYIGQTEVTQAQVGTTTRINWSGYLGKTRPVGLIPKVNAEGFCRKLSEKTGRVLRLPTEAEWEYACRAGTTTPWSSGASRAELERSAWFGGKDGSVPVAHFQPNAWGLYDMHGNVSEWCQDREAAYPRGAATDPVVKRPSGKMIVRGGDFTKGAHACRSAAREGTLRATYWIGLRVVMEVEPEQLAMKLPPRLEPERSEDDAIARISAELEKGAKVNAHSEPQGTRLHLAAANGYLKLAALLIQKGANVNAPAGPKGKWTPLHSAALRGQTQMVRFLIDKGAEVKSQDLVARTPLSYALACAHEETASLLIAKGTPVKTYARPPINDAAEGGSVTLVRLLLEKGASLSHPDPRRNGPLFYALRGMDRATDPQKKRDYAEVIKLLIRKGANVTLRLPVGPTYADGAPQVRTGPLTSQNLIHWAAARGLEDIVELCIEKGVSVNLTDSRRNIPLHFAAESGNRDMVAFLLGKGARVDAANWKKRTPLHAAAASGNPEVIELLLGKGAAVDATDTDGKTPLMAAARAGSSGAVRMLLDKGADVHAKILYGGRFVAGTVLHEAVGKADKELLDLLVSKGLDVKTASRGRSTPLYWAAAAGNIAAAEWLLQKDADINTGNGQGRTPLMAAAAAKQAEMVRFLIDKGADVTRADRYYGDTLLHKLVTWADTKLLESVLDAGADVNARNKRGVSPLTLAMDADAEEVVELLIAKDANVNVTGRTGDTPLILAVGRGDKALVKRLIALGADVNVKGSRERTALHHAASGKDPEIVELLLSKGGDLHAKDETDAAPINWAAAFGDKAVIELLLRKGADIHATERNGSTTLHNAAYGGNVEAARLLITRGLDVNARNDKGETALHVAAHSRGDPDHRVNLESITAIAKLLVDAGADLRATNKDGKTPLELAQNRRRRDIVALLRSKGVGLAAQDRKPSEMRDAITSGDIKTVRELLKLRPDFAKVKEYDWPMLLHAVRHGRKEIAKFLLERGAEVNVETPDRGTVLHEAIRMGDVEMVKILVEKGADVNIVSPGTYETPVQMAERGGHKEIAALLKSKGGTTEPPSEVIMKSVAYAVSTGNVESARRYLTQRTDITAKGETGGALLHVALSGYNYNYDMVEFLVTEGADVNTKSPWGQTPLSLAVDRGRARAAKLLLEKGAKVDNALRLDRDGNGIIHKAAGDPDFSVEVIRLLLAAGADVKLKAKNGKTPVVVAFERGRRDVGKLLLEKGADPNVYIGRHGMLLHWAVNQKDKELVEALLKSGADVKATDGRRKTALHYAVERGLEEIAALLLDKGADPTIERHGTPSPGRIAVQTGRANIVKMILAKAPGPGGKGERASSLLFVAAEVGQKEIAELLIQEGADVNHRDSRSNKPLHLAAANGKTEVCALLVAKGAKIDSRGEGKRTALFLAVGPGHVETVRLLLEKGANPTIKDESGRRPLALATREGHGNIAELLRKHGAKEEPEPEGTRPRRYR